MQARTERDFDTVFANLVELRASGLVIGGDPIFNSHAGHLGALAYRHAVPAIFQFRSFAEAGGLVSYGASLTAIYRQAGAYVSRILGGVRPSDLPVLQPTKLELVLNLKSASALGLTIPPLLLGRADEMIE